MLYLYDKLVLLRHTVLSPQGLLQDLQSTSQVTSIFTVLRSASTDQPLEKCIVVTGGNRGIGYMFIRAAAQAGAT